MTLQDARMPSLKDKLQAEAEAEEAENVRAKLEEKDEKMKKVIKKKSNKK